MDSFEAIVRLNYLLANGLYRRHNIPDGRIRTGQVLGGYDIYKPIAGQDREAFIKAIVALERETRLRSAIQGIIRDEAINELPRREVMNEEGSRDGDAVRVREGHSAEDPRNSNSLLGLRKEKA